MVRRAIRDFFGGKCPCGGAVEKNPDGEAQDRGLRPSAAASCVRPPLRRLVITALPPPSAPWKQAPGRDPKEWQSAPPECNQGGTWLTHDYLRSGLSLPINRFISTGPGLYPTVERQCIDD